ncbi:GNAT family N-acetyltransferase [Pontibacter sp. CAU 1760]
MITLVRTDSSNADFVALVLLLDTDLAIRDGEDHSFYAQFNKLDSIRNAVVAYAGEQAVGCGAFKPYADDAVEVKRMYVLPACRRQGVAKSVLSELETWAQQIGYSRLVLETGKAQPEAIQLYLRSHYEQIPNYGQYAGIENSVCMQKLLPSPPIQASHKGGLTS